VIGLLPLLGATQLTVIEPFPAVAVTAVGAAGGLSGRDGVTALEGAEGGLLATPLFAETVKVHVVPFVSPVIVAVLAGGDPLTTVGVWAVEPTYGVIAYDVIGKPPLLVGGVHDTVAEPLPPDAVTPVGDVGAEGAV
jgi:hypothetical protein